MPVCAGKCTLTTPQKQAVLCREWDLILTESVPALDNLFRGLTNYLKTASSPSVKSPRLYLSAVENPLTRAFFVPRMGLEPIRAFAHNILSVACLPIPPPRHLFAFLLILASGEIIAQMLCLDSNYVTVFATG